MEGEISGSRPTMSTCNLPIIRDFNLDEARKEAKHPLDPRRVNGSQWPHEDIKKIDRWPKSQQNWIKRTVSWPLLNILILPSPKLFNEINQFRTQALSLHSTTRESKEVPPKIQHNYPFTTKRQKEWASKALLWLISNAIIGQSRKREAQIN